MFLFIYKKVTDIWNSEVDSRNRIFKMAVAQFFQQGTADVLLLGKNKTCHQATSHRSAVLFFLTFVQMHVFYWVFLALLLLFVGI